MNVSLSGAGFLGVYHLGVAACLRRHAKASLLARSRFAGASAGSLVGAALACDVPLEPCLKAFLDTAARVRSLWGGALNREAQIDAAITTAFDTVFPSGGFQHAQNRLFVSLTELPAMRNLLVSEFTDDDDLRTALLCSSYIPAFTAAVPPRFRGRRIYVDGGFSNNLPVIPGAEHTITVTPFYGKFDICPRSVADTQKLFWFGYEASTANLAAATRALHPPNNEALLKIHQEGYDNAAGYLRDRLGWQIDTTVVVPTLPKHLSSSDVPPLRSP